MTIENSPLTIKASNFIQNNLYFLKLDDADIIYNIKYKYLLVIYTLDYGPHTHLRCLNFNEDGSDINEITLNFPSNKELKLVSFDEFGKEILSKILEKKLSNTLMSKPFKIYCAPEFFVEDKEGKCIPAYHYLNNISSSLVTDTSITNYGNKPIYFDDVKAKFEAAISSCLSWHIDSVASGIFSLNHFSKAKFPDSKISINSVMDFPIENEKTSIVNKKSLNVYNLKIKVPPKHTLPFKVANGNISIIHERPVVFDKEQIVNVVKSMDAILGVACVSLLGKLDDPRRRVVNGLPGEYSIPSSDTIQYRVLSNTWYCHPFITNLVYDLARKAAQIGYLNLGFVWKAKEKEIIDCIIKCDVKAARRILKRNKNVFIHLLKSSYFNISDFSLEKLFDIFIKGADSIIKDPYNIYCNWFNANNIWVTHCDGINKNVNSVIRSYCKFLLNLQDSKTKKYIFESDLQIQDLTLLKKRKINFYI